MAFSEIEGVIGAALPLSARRREEWWTNSENGHSQARAWRRASYRTSKVDLVNETVDFVLEDWPEGYRKPVLAGKHQRGRLAQTGLSEPAQPGYEVVPDHARVHPLFGIWEGKVTLVPGYDYTKPALAADDP
ncbi:MAG: hypothetical protein ABI399_00085 [Bauldia sp.]